MNSDRSFVHLHNHTEYSMLDGYQQHKELVARVTDLGQPAVAMTDHGNLFGAFSFYNAMTKAGIQPIIGIEAYVAPSSRRSRTQEFWDPRGRRTKKDRAEEGDGKDISGGGRFTHLTLLAKDATGLRQLYELAGRASLEGQYPRGKARMDRELFEEVVGAHGQHLIASTGCPSSEVQTRLRLGQYEQARAAAAYYRDLFGQENYFVEVMDHGIAFERQSRADLLRIGKELGIHPLATNDAHYVYPDQAHGHDCLLCIGTGNFLSDVDRLKFDGGGYCVKSAAEMRALFDAEIPGACDNTLLVADMIGTYEQMFAFRDRMPHPPVPEGFSEESYLRHLVDLGLTGRYGTAVPAAARERAEYELSIILPLGFAGYFIMLFLLCGFMREQGIRFGPRGSAAGSIVVYALEISDMDPLRHKLMFERFMNPERISPPDVDLDIDERRRDEVIAYAVRTYGAENVSQIITFGRMKTRASLKDSARIQQLPIKTGERAAEAIPPDAAGFGVTFDEIFDANHPRYDEGRAFRELAATDPEIGKILDVARLVEGRVRQTGMHACGLIVSSEPLLGQVPLWLDLPKEADAKKGKTPTLLAGHEYPDLESMGLQKMDLLGLRTWTVIDDTIKAIERDRGIRIDTEQLNGFDDPGVYAMLARGESVGVFQLEGSGITALLRMMKPTCFEDVMAVGALYRPGPMGMKSHENYALRKNGKQPITPIHPQLENPLREVLEPTYGVICYQEQVIDAAMIVAGYTRGQADLLRKVMGKKKKDLLAKEYEPFSRAMLARDYCQAAVDALWNTLVPFAEYAFNRAHTACYGRLAYVTAWLKLHHPTEYLAALLTSVSAKDKDKAALYLAECRRLGVQVLPPDVNESLAEMTAVDGKIRYGLHAIRDVGSGVVEAIIRGRAECPYAGFLDFVERVPAVGCTKKAVLGLIEAGAFDSLGHGRSSLTAVAEQAVEASTKDKKAESSGAFTLFDGLDAGRTGLRLAGIRIPDIAEWPAKQLLATERERLGLYVSGHPLDGAAQVLAANRTETLLEIRERETFDGQVQVSGVISNLTCRMAKSGMMATFDVEDLDTSVRCVVFPRTYEVLGSALADDVIVSLKGRLNEYEGEPNIVVDMMMVLDLPDEPAHVVLRMPVERVTPERVEGLRLALARHRGNQRVFVDLLLENGGVRPLTLKRAGVTPSHAFYAEVRALLEGDVVGAATA